MREFPKTMVLRGRTFTKAELTLLSRTVKKDSNLGRYQISRKLCDLLNWKQPNGWLKDRACRDVLLRLEEGGYIQLPPRRSTPSNRPATTLSNVLDQFDLETIRSRTIGELKFESVKGTRDEQIWNEAVKKFHYLSFKVSVGQTIKYLVRDDEGLIGAISLAQCAFGLASRDQFLNHINLEKNCVANNSRFLIFPNVRVPNLASQILSKFAKIAPKDWESYYFEKLKYIETFVDDSRFSGTCYRAANWIEIGKTKGYKKSGASHHNSQPKKTIFLYPLSRQYRKTLQQFLQKRNGTPK